jgi:hypothetical protein
MGFTSLRPAPSPSYQQPSSASLCFPIEGIFFFQGTILIKIIIRIFPINWHSYESTFCFLLPAFINLNCIKKGINAFLRGDGEWLHS